MGFPVTICCLVFVAQAVCAHSKNKLSFFEVLPIVMAGLILSVYICGLASHLSWGVYLFAGLSIGCLLSLLAHPKKWQLTFNRQVWMFLAISCFFYFAHWMRGLSHGDEYTHWALTVKNMFFLDRLAVDPLSVTSYKDYPPATAIVEFVVLKFSGKFSEADLFRGISLFIFSPMLIIADGLTVNRKNVDFIFLSVAACVVPAIFYYAYTETLADCSLGVYFALLFISYYRYMEEKRQIFLWQGISAAVILALVKNTGIGMVLLCCILIFCDGKERTKATTSNHGYIYIYHSLRSPLSAPLSPGQSH